MMGGCAQVGLQVALLASWSTTTAAFAGVQTFQRNKAATGAVNLRDNNQRNGSFPKPTIASVTLGAQNNGEDEEEDPLMNDQREGMANAFAALDGLTGDDFDDLRPLSSTANAADPNSFDPNEARMFMEMQAELSAKGQEGVYGDILGDMTGDNPGGYDAPMSYMQTGQEDVTGLGQALDQAADVLYDADGLGTVDPGMGNYDAQLTTADVSNDILNQEIKPSFSMDDFMTSALQEASEEIVASTEMAETSSPGRTEDIAKTAEQLLEDQELRREIENIFDNAGEKLRWEVEAMKREQAAVTQNASQQGLEYLESEKQRISEAEASVSRLINKVAQETESVQQAMADLDAVKNQVSEGSSGSIEDTALDLKQGGIVKQASLVGALLFGSRAVTETILVVGSPYGEQHFVPAILQAVIGIACAAYFFLVK